MESAMLTTTYCSVALPWPPGEPRQSQNQQVGASLLSLLRAFPRVPAYREGEEREQGTR